MKILIVEDEKDLCSTVAKGLKHSGYVVETCTDGEEASFMAIDEYYDLIVLDINLPKVSGIEILKLIRESNKEVKVILLTARANIEDKILGLDLGANDYMTKPFHFEELEARIRGLLRQNVVISNSKIQCGNLVYDTAVNKAFANGELLDLTNRERGLVEYFMKNKDRYVTASEIMEHVWESSVDINSNAVRVHISSLRKKIKDKIGFDMIENKINLGYTIKERQ